MVVWRRANIMLANIIHGDPSHESTPLPRRPRRGGLYFCVKRAKNKGRVLSAAPRLGMFQLVTGDGGRLGHKLAIRTIYLDRKAPEKISAASLLARVCVGFRHWPLAEERTLLSAQPRQRRS